MSMVGAPFTGPTHKERVLRHFVLKVEVLDKDFSLLATRRGECSSSNHSLPRKMNMIKIIGLPISCKYSLLVNGRF